MFFKTKTILTLLIVFTLAGVFLLSPHSFAGEVKDLVAGEFFDSIDKKDPASTVLWDTTNKYITLSDDNVTDKSNNGIYKTTSGDMLEARYSNKIVNGEDYVLALNMGNTSYKIVTFKNGSYKDITGSVPNFSSSNSVVRFISCNFSYCILGFDVLGEQRSHLVRILPNGTVLSLDEQLYSVAPRVQLTAAGFGNGQFLIAGKDEAGRMNLYTFNDVSMFEMYRDVPGFEARRDQIYTISWGDNKWFLGGGSYDNKNPSAAIYDQFANKVTMMRDSLISLIDRRIIFQSSFDGVSWIFTATDKDRELAKTKLMSYRIDIGSGEDQRLSEITNFKFSIYDLKKEGSWYYFAGEAGHFVKYRDGVTYDMEGSLRGWDKKNVYAIASMGTKGVYIFGERGKSNLIEEKQQRSGIALSTKLNTVDGGIKTVELLVDEDRPVGTSIKYMISVNGGKSFKEVKNKEVIQFDKDFGNDLRWKAELTTNNDTVRPKVRSMFIKYKLIKYDYVKASALKEFGGSLLSRVIAPIRSSSDKYEPKPFTPYSTGVQISSASGFLFGNGQTQIATIPQEKEPLLRVFNADTKEMLYETYVFHPTFNGGVNMVVADLDNNGSEEIIVAPASSGGPHVRIYTYAGSNKLKLYGQFFAYDEKYRGGVKLAAGDVDGDGKDEIVTWPVSGPTDIRVWELREKGWWSLDWRIMPFGLNYTGGADIAVRNITWDPTYDMTQDKREELIIIPTGHHTPELVIYGLEQNEKWRQHARVLALDPTLTTGMRMATGNLYGNNFNEIVVWPVGKGKKTANIWQWTTTEARSELKKVHSMSYPASGVLPPGIEVNFSVANTEGDEHDEVIAITNADQLKKIKAKFEIFNLRDTVKNGTLSFDLKLNKAIDVFADVKNKIIDFLANF